MESAKLYPLSRNRFAHSAVVNPPAIPPKPKLLDEVRQAIRRRPPSWWKFVSSVSMPEKFLPQLPYNERSQSDQGLGIPLKQPSTASLVLDLSIHRFVAGGSDH